MNLSDLAAPFKPSDLQWRAQACGVTANGRPWVRVMTYVNNRAIQDRLDLVCGHTNWRNEFTPAPVGGVMCGLSIFDEEKREWITKYDAAENTQVEGVKGGISDAMKRAAVQWGIGRYLYHLPVSLAMCTLERPVNRDGWQEAWDKKTQRKIYWTAPDMPDWALPPN